MEENRLQEIIEELWPGLRKKHLYPEIPKPRIGKIDDTDTDESGKDEGVGLEMKAKQMTISGAFLSGIKGKICEQKAIEALLDHGITHYTFCPWDFHTHLMLYAEAKKVMGDKELAKKAADYFIDIIADTYCVKKKVTEIPELHRVLKKGTVEDVIGALYQRIWGIDLGASAGHQDVVRRLARIPYLDRSRWPESIKKFSRSIKLLLLEAQKEQEARGGAGTAQPSRGARRVQLFE